ncbi:MAG: phospholipase D-like domain-containing protein [Bacteroidota bacterium]
MEELIKLIENTFEKQIIDKESKKAFKKLLSVKTIKQEDLNYLSHKAFLLIKEKTDGTVNQFHLDWLEDILNIINLYRIPEINDEIVCFSPQNKCSETIKKFLDTAKDTIQICVFTISDDSISRKIIECYERGVKIRIITDNDKQYDRGSDISYLAQKGIEIKVDLTRHHMHHKFAVVDNSAILTGSYNWTRSAEKYNHENLIITQNANFIRIFKNEFEHLWKQMTEYS